MKALRNLFVAALATSFALSAAAAVDFGGSVSNDSSLSVREESDFLQENKLVLWVSSDFGTYYSFKAAASATVRSEEPNFYADLEQFSFSGAFPNMEQGPSLFSFETGRYFESEFSGRLFAHPMDGMRLQFAYPRSQGKVSFGYTGLLNKENSSILLSRADVMDLADDDVYFAPPRLIGLLAWEFPELFARQTLSFSAIVQEDLRHLSEDLIEEGAETLAPSSGGRLDTQYLGLGLGGPLRSALYYDLFVYLGTGRMLTFGEDSASSTGESYSYEDILSLMLGGSARYYFPGAGKPVASLRFLYAGGDKDARSYLEGNTKGNYTGFLPLAGRSNGLVFSPKSSNLALAELAFSMKPFGSLRNSPLESIQTSLGVTPYFKTAAGAMSAPEVDPSADAGYLGTEIAGTVNYRPFSDLGLGVSAGVFLPNAEAFLEGEDATWVFAKLAFSFSF